MDTQDNPRRRLEAKSVAEQAAEWLMILEDQGAQANAAFSDWLRESPTHVQAYLRAATLDTMIRRVDPERSIETPKPPPGMFIPDIPPELGQTTSMRGKGRPAWRLAASVALGAVLLGGSWAAFERTNDRSSMSYRTDIGEQRAVELQDGSTLTLNTDSRVRIRFTGTERRVSLLRGEAAFRVNRDPLRPFRVYSGDAVVQAIGTEFNVYRKAGETTVSVLEGRVAVMPARASGTGNAAAATADKDPGTPTAGHVYLNAGEELRLDERGAGATKQRANIAKVTAWRQRRLVFVDEPLSAIGYELNRYNRSPKIRIEGPAVQQRRYAVILDADDPESLIAVLAGDPKIVVEHGPGELIVRER